jgi:hypothetical protein
MADKNNRAYKDPDLAYTGPGHALSTKELKRQGMWDAGMLQEMDLKFQAAMTSAITSGAESAPTAPSTCYGTRCPVANYSRP